MNDDVRYRRRLEPNESAFSNLVPEGRLTEGGIFRANPAMQAPSANAIAAMRQFALKRDAAGS